MRVSIPLLLEPFSHPRREVKYKADPSNEITGEYSGFEVFTVDPIFCSFTLRGTSICRSEPFSHPRREVKYKADPSNEITGEYSGFEVFTVDPIFCSFTLRGTSIC